MNSVLWRIKDTTSSANNCDSSTVLNWAITGGHTQFVNFATRGVNALDSVFSDDRQMISSISYKPPIGHSDHCIVDFLFFIENSADINGGTNGSTVQYNWHATDFGSTELYLDSTNWDEVIFHNPSALASWSAFLDVLWFAVDTLVPHKGKTKTGRRKNYPRDCEIDRQKAWIMEKCTSSPPNLTVRWQYRDCVNQFHACCRKLTKPQEDRVINANSLGAFYRHVNQRVTHRSSTGALIDSSGNTVVSDVAKAVMFNEHFAAVGIIDNGVTSHVRTVHSVCLETVSFSDTDILSAITKLKPNLSCGHDGVPPLLCGPPP